MSREEANKLIMQACERTWNEKTCKEIFKVLEQDPCTDAVSRDALLGETIRKNSIWNSITNSEGKNLEEIILELPPVTQKPTFTTDLYKKPQEQKDYTVSDRTETVTEFADRCRECGARYGKLLKQRSGHWIGHREHCENLGVMPSGLGAYEWCSNCDCGIDVREWHRNNYNYCPNCGAKMTESEE